MIKCKIDILPAAFTLFPAFGIQRRKNFFASLTRKKFLYFALKTPYPYRYLWHMFCIILSKSFFFRSYRAKLYHDEISINISGKRKK